MNNKRLVVYIVKSQKKLKPWTRGAFYLVSWLKLIWWIWTLIRRA